MLYYSTNNKNNRVSFRTAILQGLAEDGGLFMPEIIPQLDDTFLSNISKLSFEEIAFSIAQYFVEDDISSPSLEKIINSSISFEAPLKALSKQKSVLELFHGPTLAFKDFGARFMARTIEYLLKYESKNITILVATSGDTGSAVANGFFNVDGINVVILFPKDKVSKIQEKQLTTLGKNITALEVDGTFDDCQNLVKQAFVDDNLKSKKNLSSANSINIGRLIPQSFYYFESFKQIKNKHEVVYSIPSGNLGNLTAGLIAKKMGLPIKKFISATNANSVFTEYIHSGIFKPRASQTTISNAMDVGNPSNLARIIDLYNNDHSLISEVIFSRSYSDDETITAIKSIYENFKYVIDPHGAIAYLALDQYTKSVSPNANGVILETAHPAKFIDVFNNNFDFTPEMPDRLATCLDKEGNSIKVSNSYDEFKEFLLS